MKLKYISILFSIFITITSCGQIDPNKQIDEGKVDKNIYSSKEIGWTINIPKKWSIVSKEQTESYQNRGKDAIENVVDQEIDASGVKNLISFQKNQFNLFQSTSEPFKLEYDGEWEENNALLKEIIYNTYLNQGIKIDSTKTSIVKVDGLNFHSYEFTLYSPKGDTILKQLMFSRLINGFDFGVNINFNNEADKKEMLDAWLNSKFVK